MPRFLSLLVLAWVGVWGAALLEAWHRLQPWLLTWSAVVPSGVYPEADLGLDRVRIAHMDDFVLSLCADARG